MSGLKLEVSFMKFFKFKIEKDPADGQISMIFRVFTQTLESIKNVDDEVPLNPYSLQLKLKNT